MTSRKVSNSVYYPFIPFDIPGYTAAAQAIKDLFITVQGAATVTGLSGEVPRVELHTVSDQGLTTLLEFSAYYEDSRWDFGIEVTDNQGLVEVATDHAELQAVAIVDSDDLAGLSPSGSLIQVEPARVLWYPEQVTKVTIANIRRLNGIEEPSEERDVAVFEPIGAAPLLMEFGPGHNTEWFLDVDEAVTLDVEEAAGKGRNTDLGDTVPGGDPLPEADSVVYIINGLAPINGNIPLTTSESLGLETTDGLITVVVKE